MNHRLLLTCILAVACVVQPQSLHSQTDCENLPGEASLIYSLNTIESPGLRDASIFVSDALMPLSIGTPIALYAYGALSITAFGADQNQLRYSSESGLQMGITLIGAYGLTWVLKNLADRKRPYQQYPDCITAYGSSTDPSWPSGHSAGSSAIAATLCLRYPYWYVIGPSVAYALYTGFARMHLGMHYLTDVLSGYIIGTGMALLVHHFSEEIFDFADPILPDKGAGTMGFGIIDNSIPVFSLSLSF